MVLECRFASSVENPRGASRNHSERACGRLARVHQEVWKTRSTPSPGRLQRWGARLLDGENRWGFVRIQADRFGVTRYRLVVYPPGISDTERRRLRIWRGSPIWGAALWAVVEIFLQQWIDSWSALAISTGTVLALAVVAMAKTGETRAQVRAMTVVTMAGYTDPATITARDTLLKRAMTLTNADEQVDEDVMSRLDHEALWWTIYDQLAPSGAVGGVRKMPH